MAHEHRQSPISSSLLLELMAMLLVWDVISSWTISAVLWGYYRLLSVAAVMSPVALFAIDPFIGVDQSP